IQKEPKRHIDLCLTHHLTIREVVLKLQQTQLEQPHWIFRWRAHPCRITVGYQRPQRLEVNRRFEPAQIMIGRNQFGKDHLIQVCWFQVVLRSEHRLCSPFSCCANLTTPLLLCQLFKRSPRALCSGVCPSALFALGGGEGRARHQAQESRMKKL